MSKTAPITIPNHPYGVPSSSATGDPVAIAALYAALAQRAHDRLAAEAAATASERDARERRAQNDLAERFFDTVPSEFWRDGWRLEVRRNAYGGIRREAEYDLWLIADFLSAAGNDPVELLIREGGSRHRFLALARGSQVEVGGVPLDLDAARDQLAPLLAIVAAAIERERQDRAVVERYDAERAARGALVAEKQAAAELECRALVDDARAKWGWPRDEVLSVRRITWQASEDVTREFYAPPWGYVLGDDATHIEIDALEYEGPRHLRIACPNGVLIETLTWRGEADLPADLRLRLQAHVTISLAGEDYPCAFAESGTEWLPAPGVLAELRGLLHPPYPDGLRYTLTLSAAHTYAADGTELPAATEDADDGRSI